MSIDLMSDVWKRGPVDRSQRLLMLAIADNANDQGICWPSTQHLAHKASMSLRTVLRGLAALERDGWIKITKKSHLSKGNTYEVDLDKLGDSMSRDNKSRDKSGSSQVTNQTKSGDKTGSYNRKNHQEPSKNLLADDGHFSLDGSPKAKASVRFTADEIEGIYEAYPRKVKKRKALDAIESALKRIDHEDPARWLLAIVQEFADSPAGQKGQYTPHPATWFNGSQYLDDPDEWQRTEGGRR